MKPKAHPPTQVTPAIGPEVVGGVMVMFSTPGHGVAGIEAPTTQFTPEA